MFAFSFFYAQDDEGKWRWAIAGPDGRTVLAYCAGPSETRRACLQEIEVIRAGAREMKVRAWKPPGGRRAKRRA